MLWPAFSRTGALLVVVGLASSCAPTAASDAAGSLVVERLDANQPAALMPPGAPLGGAERCAVAQWIHDGAKR